MKQNLTELVFILDRSGSMQGLEGDTIGGFNAMIEEQKKEPGEAFVSTALFDDQTEMLHDRVRSASSPSRKGSTMSGAAPPCWTPLAGPSTTSGTSTSTPAPEDVPEHTLFVITTDGMENASRRYSAQRVKEMIQRQKEKYGWEFLFLGANIDAVETAGDLGITPDRAVNYHCDSAGHPPQLPGGGTGRGCRPVQRAPG